MLLNPFWATGSHFCPDADVYFSLALLRRMRPELFLVEKPEVFFFPAGFEIPAIKGVLVLDTGLGDFDHHGQSDFCTLDLVASAIGVEQSPQFQLFLERTRKHDLLGKDLMGERSELPKEYQGISFKRVLDGVAKRANRQSRNGDDDRRLIFWQIVRMSEAILEATVSRERMFTFNNWQSELRLAFAECLWQEQNMLGRLPGTLAETIKQIDQKWIKEGCESGFVDDRKTSKIFKVMTTDKWFEVKGNILKDAAPFSLAGVAYGLTQIEPVQKKRHELLKLCISLAYGMENDWAIALREVRDYKITRIFQVNQADPMFVAAMQSNSMTAASALRYVTGQSPIKPDVVVIFRDGQTQITVTTREHDQGTTAKLRQLLYSLGVTLRLGELLVRGQKEFDAADLETPGFSQNAPQWFIATEGNGRNATVVANRTIKNPVVPERKLSICSVVGLTQAVFRHGRVLTLDEVGQITRSGQTIEAFPDGNSFKDIRTNGIGRKK